jgi:hypothetical protein
MVNKNAFDRFAPVILKVYHHNKEAFWAAIMAPFLANDISLLSWLKNLRVDMGLLSAFRGLDNTARQTLQDFSTPLGFDLTQWKSNRWGSLSCSFGGCNRAAPGLLFSLRIQDSVG